MLAAELVAQARQVAPVAVDEAAVAPARAAAAVLRFEQDDVEPGLALFQRQRGPEARVAAADDDDIGLGVPLERRRRLIRAGLLEPPDVA
jgi:hypothetical protein